MGLKVNEWGVYRLDDGTRVAGESEADVYAALGLPWFPPELRESRHEFAAAEAGELPQLIELTDICGDLHMHTSATDGKATLDEMVAAARERGLSYIAITDHSQRVAMAQGLDATRLLGQWAEIDEANAALDDFTILKGIECDILEAGGMDLPDDVLAQADWVMASIHYGQRQSRAQITERILGAIENEYVSAIAHPTGRLLNKRDAYEVDMDAVIRAAQKHGKYLELNANPRRLDLDDVMCALGQEPRSEDRDQFGRAQHGRPGRDAVWNSAGASRWSDESGRGEYRARRSALGQDQRRVGKKHVPLTGGTCFRKVSCGVD